MRCCRGRRRPSSGEARTQRASTSRRGPAAAGGAKAGRGRPGDAGGTPAAERSGRLTEQQAAAARASASATLSSGGGWLWGRAAEAEAAKKTGSSGTGRSGGAPPGGGGEGGGDTGPRSQAAPAAAPATLGFRVGAADLRQVKPNDLSCERCASSASFRESAALSALSLSPRSARSACMDASRASARARSVAADCSPFHFSIFSNIYTRCGRSRDGLERSSSRAIFSSS